MTISKHLNLQTLALAATMLAGPLMVSAPTPASAQISLGISVQIAPPILPVYVQPAIPAPGYLWTPGYWAYADGTGYYWVPGTWIEPPEVGVLWTPPYWGWENGAYLFHAGYWGPHVGFYGGINYGFGYGGVGFGGGRWDGGHFAYNAAVNNFGSVHIDNVYRENVTVINNTHVSFNGGANGVRAEPTPEERAAENEHHIAVTSEQTRHITEAAHNPAFSASQNHGHPAIAATARPAEFTGPGVVHAGAAAARPVEHVATPHPVERAVSHPMEARPVAPHPAEARPVEAHPAAARPVEQHAAPPHRAEPHEAPAGKAEEHKPEH